MSIVDKVTGHFTGKPIIGMFRGYRNLYENCTAPDDWRRMDGKVSPEEKQYKLMGVYIPNGVFMLGIGFGCLAYGAESLPLGLVSSVLIYHSEKFRKLMNKHTQEMIIRNEKKLIGAITDEEDRADWWKCL